ncbi:MAG: HNH endonuclease, partial [Actinobacteria bacterium]|nr:HNH endonuclease [Actinomycetota bacterium]
MFALGIDDQAPSLLDQAIELLAKANSELEPEFLDSSGARVVLERYAKARRLVDYGLTAVARKVDDPALVSRATGTPVGQAKATIALGNDLKAAPELGAALQSGAVSVEQAREIASAEASVPGITEDLVAVANSEPFHVLQDKARRLKLEAEQHNGLAARQHAARSARHYSDELGMTHIHLMFEPLIATPIVNRAEADAERLYKAARKTGQTEAFEAYLADAFVDMLSGHGKGRSTRPELVVVIDYDTIRNGWELSPGGVSKIPGVGPIDPQDVKAVAQDAFINAVLVDGEDLRHFKRFGRHVPPEIKVALELGKAPGFDGPVCSDCGNRFRPERDHLEPVVAEGPTSYRNLEWKCNPCHVAKTDADR